MRLDELVLERYGPYAHRRLVLDGPGLTVVHGPNEAGKSTCLAAIGDFLFRVPERSPRGAIFGTDQMRIGATLTTADGRRLSFKRRAGRGRTLIDAGGAPIDEAPLTLLLGATGRDRFEHLFGLNHESLRAGGDQLLRADGDVGRLIVEAGGGLRALMSRLDDLDSQMDALFAPRRKASQAFYRALDAFNEADGAARAATLTRDAYERDRKAHEDAAVALEEARRGRYAAEQEMSRLTRVERVIPTLRAIAEIEASLEDFGDVRALPRDWAGRWDAALAGRDAASAALMAARERLGVLAARVAALVVDPALAAAELAVRDLDNRVTEVTGERRDRAKRHQEFNAAESRLSALRDRLGAEVDLEALMPTDAALATVRRLAAAALDRRPRLDAAREAMESARDGVAAAEARRQALAMRGRHEPFGLDAARFAALPTDARLAQAAADRAASQAGAQAARAAALGFADIGALRALSCPDPDQLRAEIKAREDLAAEAARQIAARDAAAREAASAAAEIERLRAGGEIATPEAVAAARGRRAAAWAPIRAAHVAGASPAPAPERLAQAAALESGVADADRLSDLRVSEAERVAALAEASRRLLAAQAVTQAALAAAERAEVALRRREAELRAAFPDACARRPEPGALLALIEARLDILARADASETAAGDAAQALEKLASPLRELELAEHRAGLADAAALDLTARVARLSRAIAAHEREFAEFQRDGVALAAGQAALAAAERAAAALEAEQRAWTVDWAAVAARVTGLSPGDPPEAGAELAVQWTGARGELRALGHTRRRLRRMDEDEAELKSLATALAADLAIPAPDDPVAAGAMLVERWRKNDEVRVRRETLAPEVAEAEAEVKARGEALDRAEALLMSLAAIAGKSADDDGLLSMLAHRQREFAGLNLRLAQLQAQAASAGDGLALDRLREDVSGRDLDAVRAEIAALRDRMDTLDNRRDRLNREVQQASAALAAHEGPSERAQAVARRERATAELGGAVERWVELKLARDLVNQAIASVRKEQQDPLIRAAGNLFSRMTRGEFDGVAADVDAKGAPVVVGVRRGGREESVATLSEGTRDQMFLAFRLASLANYCAATEPLPFIADDILVHFDDARAAATLDLLAEFRATTQVLLFTHHASVRAAAEPLAAAGRATIVDL